MNRVYKVLVLALCSMCFYSIVKKWEAVAHQPVSIDSLSQRLDIVRRTTPQTATIGFYSNLPNIDSSKNYFQAQLLLAPRLLVKNVELDTVVAITSKPFTGMSFKNHHVNHQSTSSNTTYTLSILNK